jgi:predicted dinucleotide-binding enzyme
MNVTIIGTGNMARGIGSRLLAGGHHVTVLAEQPADAEEVLKDLGAKGSAKAGSVRRRDLRRGSRARRLLPGRPGRPDQYGDALSGKVLVDITNPVKENLDGLVTPPDSSAAQELGARAHGARVVKAFNTTFAGTLREGRVADESLDVFVASDDEDAKATVSKLIEDGGLRPVNAGPLARARELEAAGLLHMSLQSNLGTGFGSALKVLG